MTSTSELYRRPDMMTLRDEALDIGEIVVVLERKDNWLHISGNKKTKKGWIREAGKFSMEQTDLKVALLLFKAEQADDAAQKREKAGGHSGRPIVGPVRAHPTSPICTEGNE